MTTLLEPHGGVPVALTGLVGRDEELAELEAQLPDARALTVTGPGGAGKSRLAIALAHRVRERFDGGVYWVGLAAVSDAALVDEFVLCALAPAQRAAGPAAATIARRIAGARALLVLDDCERVAEGCARLAAGLLAACPGLHVLGTSRQALGVPGERVWRMAGLSRGAVDLFLERARAASSTVVDDHGTRAAAARICERLDGLPLAVELAAARTAALSADQIAERLERGSRFLRQTSRTAPTRHRTLEATLEWSYALLPAGERAVFRRLSVFRGGFSLAAAEAVCAPHDPLDVFDAVAGLVHHSLVQVSQRSGESRYALLETVREYGEEKLREDGEHADAVAAHIAYHRDLAEQAQAGLAGPQQAEWLDRLGTEHDNLQAALASALDVDPPAGARLAVLLSPFWSRRGHYREARAGLERAVAATGDADALAAAGTFAFLQCDYPQAIERLQAALTLHRERGDRRGEATALQRLGSIEREQGRYAEARRLHRESLDKWEALEDDAGVSQSLDLLGFASWLAGDTAAARPLCERALERFRAAGDSQGTAAALVNLGACSLYAGDARRAAETFEEALSLARRIGYQEGIAWALHEVGIVARRAHDVSVAARALCDSLELHLELGDRWRAASVLEEIAGGLVARTDPRRAAELLGAASALRGRLGTPLPVAEWADHDRALRLIRRKLGAAGLQAAWEEGGTLSLDDAVAAALGSARALIDGTSAARFDGLLTAREQAVLVLLSEGRSNREIAAALFISPSTVAVHVSSILRKLGVKSRVHAAARAQQLGLLSV